jgi:hypothetical protein
MEVHPEVYNWLGALQIIDGSRPPTITNSGMAALDEDTTMDFENGAVRPFDARNARIGHPIARFARRVRKRVIIFSRLSC